MSRRSSDFGRRFLLSPKTDAFPRLFAKGPGPVSRRSHTPPEVSSSRSHRGLTPPSFRGDNRLTLTQTRQLAAQRISSDDPDQLYHALRIICQRDDISAELLAQAASILPDYPVIDWTEYLWMREADRWYETLTARSTISRRSLTSDGLARLAARHPGCPNIDWFKYLNLRYRREIKTQTRLNSNNDAHSPPLPQAPPRPANGLPMNETSSKPARARPKVQFSQPDVPLQTRVQETKRCARDVDQASTEPKRRKVKVPALGLPIVTQCVVDERDFDVIPIRGEWMAFDEPIPKEVVSIDVVMSGALNPLDKTALEMGTRRQRFIEQDDTVQQDQHGAESLTDPAVMPYRLVKVKEVFKTVHFFNLEQARRLLVDHYPGLDQDARNYHTTKEALCTIYRSAEARKAKLTEYTTQKRASSKTLAERAAIAQEEASLQEQADRLTLQQLVQYGGIFTEKTYVANHPDEKEKLCLPCLVHYPEDLLPLRLCERGISSEEVEYWMDVYKHGKNFWDQHGGHDELYKEYGLLENWGFESETSNASEQWQ
ncbi:hypothetical protein LTR64_006136 [Lithohypha guttulata]|uniref:uncharacterized protein n=1 Tax=Lithohypha guttulata TaxID=1690604 RepID=UPI002DDE4A2D|nr:hypothetical protein LTR51_002066 [Lithohypha guttulata]